MGCIIAWVANIHITNNVVEASNQIKWIVEKAHNFTSDAESVSEHDCHLIFI